MLNIGRPLPGELEGTLDPRDYGFEVIRCEVDEEEALLGAARLYRSARARTGEAIPPLDNLLAMQPYDPAPAEDLLARYENLTYPLSCEFGRARLEIDEGVFSPTLTSVSPLLLGAVDFKPDERMLDAFAGSAAFGINAALHGASVVAVDISPQAVACAEKNTRLNGVAECVDVRLGTLDTGIAPNEVFDLITANPPLIPQPATEGLRAALFDPGLQATKRLIAALPKLLADRGRCYVVTSDVIDRKGYECDIDRLCAAAGLRVSVVNQLHKEYESYRVHKIERPRLARLRLLLKS